MKALFLDIDGVLNRCGKSGQGLEEDKISLLQMILRETGCEIVLSSTWRIASHNRNRIQKLCEQQFGQDLYGCTPVHQRQSDSGLWTADIRGREIMAWLEMHPEVTHCVILDDDSDMGPLAHHLIKTESYTGLTPELAAAAILHLKSEASSVLTAA
jgi:hypothetical protein